MQLPHLVILTSIFFSISNVIPIPSNRMFMFTHGLQCIRAIVVIYFASSKANFAIALGYLDWLQKERSGTGDLYWQSNLYRQTTAFWLCDFSTRKRQDVHRRYQTERHFSCGHKRPWGRRHCRKEQSSYDCFHGMCEIA